MLTNLESRASGLNIDRKIFPDQCRFKIAMRLVRDILATKATDDIVQALSLDTRRVPFEWIETVSSLNNENTAPQNINEEQWAKFEAVY